MRHLRNYALLYTIELAEISVLNEIKGFIATITTAKYETITAKKQFLPEIP